MNFTRGKGIIKDLDIGKDRSETKIVPSYTFVSDANTGISGISGSFIFSGSLTKKERKSVHNYLSKKYTI